MRDAALAFGLDDRAAYEFVYAVNEAVTNAIKHGGADGDGTIGLGVEHHGEALVCSVRDRGPFVPPPAYAPNNLAESGRGFAFMSALTDELELAVGPTATVVRLHKRRSVVDAADAA